MAMAGDQDMTVDWTQPVKTRDGRSVRVLCTDREGFGELEVVVLINDKGRELLCSELKDGTGAIQGEPAWHIVNA